MSISGFKFAITTDTIFPLMREKLGMGINPAELRNRVRGHTMVSIKYKQGGGAVTYIPDGEPIPSGFKVEKFYAEGSFVESAGTLDYYHNHNSSFEIGLPAVDPATGQMVGGGLPVSPQERKR